MAVVNRATSGHFDIILLAGRALPKLSLLLRNLCPIRTSLLTTLSPADTTRQLVPNLNLSFGRTQLSSRLSAYVPSLLYAGVPVYLAPWTACPPGGKPTAVALPPGGQAVPGYLAPHPGYLQPQGASCPGRFILPPHPTQVKIYTCYFVIFLNHFNEFRSSISDKVRNWCLWG